MNKNPYESVLEQAIELIYKKYPSLDERFGEAGRQKCYDDNIHHLNYLDSAYSIRDEKVFIDYAVWLNSVLVSRGMKSDHLVDNFIFLKESFSDYREMDSDRKEGYVKYLTCAVEAIQNQG
ncbi:hypothetical protein [Falsibacillus pallidus]|uniref:Uncharacterized protein n=1 Tax=Falsibacillus pallidus TaxID=493781 RepID=A0A370GRL3_9BACI|nr:hypothetical protein [Falsibacillus pallidus]RDI45960.1 hypothetical protein DFR59_102598 [Falsibacillus pallidus]